MFVYAYGLKQVWHGRQILSKLWSKNPKEKITEGDLGKDESVILK